MYFYYCQWKAEMLKGTLKSFVFCHIKTCSGTSLKIDITLLLLLWLYDHYLSLAQPSPLSRVSGKSGFLPGRKAKGTSSATNVEWTIQTRALYSDTLECVIVAFKIRCFIYYFQHVEKIAFKVSIVIISINVSTELEMTPDARHNGGKAHKVKHCKCA